MSRVAIAPGVAFATAEAASDARADERIAGLAVRSLWDELALSPKPGLVSLDDVGAHDDMNARTFVRSIAALRPGFAALAGAGARGAEFATLRAIGVAAEHAMLAATGGVNTHRGAIFVVGLLCAAVARIRAARGTPDDAAVRAMLRTSWGSALDAHGPSEGAPSHGTLAARRHGAGGAREEARRAFPAVFDVALPALRGARARGSEERHARLIALAELLGSVDDTNVLHRGGAAGLAHVQARARAARNAPDVEAALRALHADLVARRLSPGGSADLLAGTLFVDAVQSSRA